MEKKLRFALIGCGRIAKKHAAVISKLDNASLCAVSDVVPERAKNFSQQYNVPYYTDYIKMLEKEGIDVINILTPSGTHADIGIKAARFKKHLVIEKPMALKLEDADNLIKACADNKIKLFVVKQNRYNLPVQKLKTALDAGRFGKLVLGTARVRWCRDQAYYDQDAWRGTWAMDGGVFANQASHHIDLLQWMMGPVASVMAKTSTILHKIEVEDTGIAILKFENGALGVVEATTCTRPKDLEGSISILGEKGTVEIGGFAANQIKVWEFFQRLPEDVEIMTRYNQNPPDVYGWGHAEFLKAVIDSIKNDVSFSIDGPEGRKSLELINAIYESVDTGKEVFLKSMTGNCRLVRH